MNEERDMVSENIGALCALLAELTATVDRQGKQLEVMEQRIDKDLKALLDGMFVMLNNESAQPVSRTWRQRLGTVCEIGLWMLLGVVVTAGLLGLAMRYYIEP